MNSLKFEPYTPSFIAEEIINGGYIKLKFCSEFPPERRWFFFDKSTKLWVNCLKNEHENSIKNILLKYSNEARVGNGLESKSPRRHEQIAEKMGSAGMLTDVLIMLRSHPKVAVLASEWDSNPMELSTPSEIIDLNNFKIRKRSESDLNLKVTACDIDDGFPVDFFNFLLKTQNGNMENVKYIQKMCGYFLTGLISLELFFVLYGDGGNGKGTFFEVLDYILGGDNPNSQSSYAAKVNARMFIKGAYEDRFDLSTLQGKRLIYASEVKADCTFDKEKVNLLTGGDRVSTEFKGGHRFQYKPNFKCILSVNNKPKMESVDNSMVRRLRLIPFLVEVKEEDKDTQLKHKLKKDAGKILGWFLVGLKELIEDHWNMIPPKEIEDATNEYLTDEDFFGTWFKYHVTKTDDRTKMDLSSRFYLSWKIYCQDHGEPIITQMAFSKLMSKKCRKKIRTADGILFDGYCLTVDEKIKVTNSEEATDSFYSKRRVYQ
jgi:P4 family phage/plasmid primase-like protien